MKHFIKDITDQVVLDVKPYGRLMSFSQIAEVDAGNIHQGILGWSCQCGYGGN